jgi:hypothetical protein
MSDQKENLEVLLNGAKYRSIIDAKWQTWGGFTSHLFAGGSDERYFCKVTYHFDSNCQELQCVNFKEDMMYWGTVHSSQLYIPCKSERDISKIMESVFYLDKVYKFETEYANGTDTEIVVRSIRRENEYQDCSITVEAYWLFYPKSKNA